MQLDKLRVMGVDVVAQGLGAFWASITGTGYRLEHEPLNIYGDDQRFVLEALNHYLRDGQRVTVRATARTDRNAEHQVPSVRLYQDLSPLYAGAQIASAGRPG